MSELDLHIGDVLEWAKCYEGAPFMAMVTDPPYHLNSIVKRFGGENSAQAQSGTTGVYRRASRGFMNEQWDGGDIAFRSETWAALAEHLLPGAFIFAFCGSRGWHRQAVAMEDAGLIMGTSLFLWGFGSGFPKATRVKGDERFDQHRYGGQMIKPAAEPILLFQKPYAGRPLDCITQTGAGTVNIGAGRIGTQSLESHGSKGDGVSGSMAGVLRPLNRGQNQWEGRWPANLLIGDADSAAMLDQQSGVLTSGKPAGVKKAGNNIYGEYGTGLPITGFGDTGGASRYFHTSDQQAEEFEDERFWNSGVAEALQASDGLFYSAKAGRVERDAGLETFDAQAIGDGRPSPIDNPYQRGETPNRNPHPCVKPISMLRHLCALLLPPPDFGPRRILVPFAGSGSECVAASLAGWEIVQGIEGKAEYEAIARRRFDFWNMNSGLFEELTATTEEEEAQGDLFAEEAA